MPKAAQYLIALMTVVFLSLIIYTTVSHQRSSTETLQRAAWRQGWDAARWAIGSENSYARNAAERVQRSYLICRGAGGEWAAEKTRCEN